ncbi:MAG TPA: orotidine-5'-phosphate decarboxylase [Bryobacteraceae bacterium]|nr:orotidine-5'-phosphate decarboxylase [Bryobacteraceae bacterium]
MRLFSDRLVEAIRKTESPCVVGLDPRIELMPAFIKSGRGALTPDVVRSAIRDFHELVLDTIAGLAAIVKPQLAFYEQYGSAGIQAFEDTVQAAKQRGLLVIADGKRNDVDSTAEAYAAAYLGETSFDVDAMTVTPYLGPDSMLPYLDACRRHGKGIFVVLKTSNPGSRDYQDQILQGTGRPLYESIAQTIRDFGEGQIGESGYSSVGAVVGATFPEDARRLRALLPHAFILVTGYGTQGASSEGAAACFNGDGLGAIVNSSRGITYAFGNESVTKEKFVKSVRENTLRMRDEIAAALTISS